MSAVQSPLLWVLALSSAVAGSYLVAPVRPDSRFGFHDNRFTSSGKQSISEKTQHWDDEQIAEVTREYVLKGSTKWEASERGHVFQNWGDRTHFTVMCLLGEQARYSQLATVIVEAAKPRSPLHRACELLGDSPPIAAADLLAPFLDDHSVDIRQIAALVIGKTGAASIAPSMKRAFADEESAVRDCALTGLKIASDRKGLAEDVGVELVPSLMDLLRTRPKSEKAAHLLFHINSTKATEFFLSPEMFHGDSPNIDSILAVLADARTPVEREMLTGLIAALDQPDLQHPKNRALAEALRLLGQHEQAEDRDFIQSYMARQDAVVATGAAEGLICSYGLEGFQQRILDMESGTGYHMLTEIQKQYRAVVMCNAEVLSGGFSEFFRDMKGKRWRDALAGFKAMGFNERLGIYEKAIGQFGPSGPSLHHGKRSEQVRRINGTDKSALRDLDRDYRESQEVVYVHIVRFVLEHQDEFR